MIDLNKFAKTITLKEGLKKSLNIAQVKEVIRITLKNLKNVTVDELMALLKRVK